MARKAKIIDKDLGYQRILRDIKRFKHKPFVKVGYLKSAGIHKEAEGMTVAEVAIIHEFGSQDGKTPERSHLRSTHDEKRSEWRRVTNRLGVKIILGKVSLDRALGIMGEMIKKDFKKKITSGDFTPNAPSTVARKGSDKPLIDTAQMLNSIQYEKVIPR